MKVGKHNSKKKFEIFKIQRPLGMIGTSVLVLVYNYDRSIYGQFPMSQELAKLMGADFKIYVKGYIDNSDMLQVVEKTTSRNW